MYPRNDLLYAVRQDETDKKTEEGATLDTVIFSFVEELDSRLLVAVLVYVYLSSFNTRKQSKPVVRKVSSNNSNTISLVLMATSSAVQCNAVRKVNDHLALVLLRVSGERHGGDWLDNIWHTCGQELGQTRLHSLY